MQLQKVQFWLTASVYTVGFRPSRFVGFQKSNLCFVGKIMWVDKWNSWWPPNLHSYIRTWTIKRMDVTLTLLQGAKSQLDALFVSNFLYPLFQDSLSLKPEPLRRWKGLTSKIILLPLHHRFYRSCTSISSTQRPVIMNFSLRQTSIIAKRNYFAATRNNELLPMYTRKKHHGS